MALNWMLTGLRETLAKEEIIITENEQTTINLTETYITDIGMIDIYRNGILQEKTLFTEINETTLEYTDLNNLLEIDDIITVRHHLSEGLNIGDLTVVATYADLLAIKSAKFNDVAIVTNLKKFYHYGISGWDEWTIPFTVNNIGMIFEYEKQAITDTLETTYTLDNISYNPGTGNLLVFINGLIVKDYTEVDPNTITFDFEELPEGYIEFFVSNTDSFEDSNDHEIEYEYDENRNIFKETITAGGGEIKSTVLSYDNGNIVSEVITKNNKIITKNYSYNPNNNISNVSITVTNQ
jgi:hypothetical protein